MNRLVISGYYGFENIGDESILAGMVKSLRKIEPGVGITVLSQRPEITASRYGVDSVSRTDLPAIISAIRQSELFISGGGSLLQDVTGIKTIPYYLGLVFLAQMLGKKTAFYAQGIGPVSREINRILLKWIGNRTDLITVRDSDSCSLLMDLGIDAGLIRQYVDPAFALTPGQKLVNDNNDQKKIIGISVRPWGDNSYLTPLAHSVDFLAKKLDAEIIIIAMHYYEDQGITYEFRDKLEAEARIVNKVFTPREMLEQFNVFDIFIGVRLHSLIYAVICGLPFVGISYDPKVDSFIKRFYQGPSLKIENLESGELREQLITTWQEREDLKETIRETVAGYRDLCLENARAVLSLI